MKVIYVAGPFRAFEQWEIERNIRRAEDLAAEVWRLGAAALCPHQLTRPFQEMIEDAAVLAAGLELLTRSDAMIAGLGWDESIGTLEEMREAFERKIPVFLSLEHLARWLASGGVDCAELLEVAELAYKARTTERRERFNGREWIGPLGEGLKIEAELSALGYQVGHEIRMDGTMTIHPAGSLALGYLARRA